MRKTDSYLLIDQEWICHPLLLLKSATVFQDSGFDQNFPGTNWCIGINLFNIGGKKIFIFFFRKSQIPYDIEGVFQKQRIVCFSENVSIYLFTNLFPLIHPVLELVFGTDLCQRRIVCSRIIKQESFRGMTDPQHITGIETSGKQPYHD